MLVNVASYMFSINPELSKLCRHIRLRPTQKFFAQNAFRSFLKLLPVMLFTFPIVFVAINLCSNLDNIIIVFKNNSTLVYECSIRP